MSVLPWVQASPHVAPVGAHVVVTHRYLILLPVGLFPWEYIHKRKITGTKAKRDLLNLLPEDNPENLNQSTAGSFKDRIIIDHVKIQEDLSFIKLQQGLSDILQRIAF